MEDICMYMEDICVYMEGICMYAEDMCMHMEGVCVCMWHIHIQGHVEAISIAVVALVLTCLERFRALSVLELWRCRSPGACRSDSDRCCRSCNDMFGAISIAEGIFTCGDADRQGHVEAISIAVMFGAISIAGVSVVVAMPIAGGM